MFKGSPVFQINTKKPWHSTFRRHPLSICSKTQTNQCFPVLFSCHTPALCWAGMHGIPWNAWNAWNAWKREEPSPHPAPRADFLKTCLCTFQVLSTCWAAPTQGKQNETLATFLDKNQGTLSLFFFHSQKQRQQFTYLEFPFHPNLSQTHKVDNPDTPPPCYANRRFSFLHPPCSATPNIHFVTTVQSGCQLWLRDQEHTHSLPTPASLVKCYICIDDSHA